LVSKPGRLDTMEVHGQLSSHKCSQLSLNNQTTSQQLEKLYGIEYLAKKDIDERKAKIIKEQAK